jgi:hypothetical protein
MPAMSVLETVQQQVLQAITAGEDVVLSGVKTLAERAKPVTGKLPEVPFADRLPDPADVADNAFTFAEKLLANQRAFAVKLADAYRPATPSSSSSRKPASRKPVAKRATKRATKSAAKAG